MGTRGVWGFVLDGEKKFAYNHYDSYPSALGADLAKALREFPGTVDELKDKVRSITLIANEDDEPTDEQVQELIQYADLGVSTKSPKEWYVLLRETQGDLNKTLSAGYMIDNADFGYDRISCEYGYVIDLDAETFTVFGAEAKDPSLSTPWDEPGRSSITPSAQFSLAEVLTDPLIEHKIEATDVSDE